MTKLLIGNSFSHSTMIGNCGIRQIYRLTASYIDAAESAKRYTAAVKKRHMYKIVPPPEDATFRSIIQAWRRPCKAGNNRNYPLWWAFVETLEYLDADGYALAVMSDTEDGQGDGHKGDYATRHFAQWMLDNELATAVSLTGARRCVPLTTSDKDYRLITCWTMIPNAEAIHDMVERGKTAVRVAIDIENQNPDLISSQDVSTDTVTQRVRELYEEQEYGRGVRPLDRAAGMVPRYLQGRQATEVTYDEAEAVNGEDVVRWEPDSVPAFPPVVRGPVRGHWPGASLNNSRIQNNYQIQSRASLIEDREIMNMFMNDFDPTAANEGNRDDE